MFCCHVDPSLKENGGGGDVGMRGQREGCTPPPGIIPVLFISSDYREFISCALIVTTTASRKLSDLPF